MLHERKNKERVSILKGINKKTYHVLVHSQLVVPFQQFYFRMYWCWRRHLRVPWTARRCNQSILKEISPGCSLEGLMLKLKLQYFGHLMRRFDSLEKTLMLGGIGGRREGDGRRWDGWLALPMRWTWVCVNSVSWWWTGRPGVLRFMGLQRVGHNWAIELKWTELSKYGRVN